jgi:hypothetical protein
MPADWPILSTLVWLPIGAGILLLLLGGERAAFGRWLALLATLATLGLSAMLWRDFDRTTAAMQFVEHEPWIGALNSWYYLGVDGISMPLIVLTAFITPLVVIAAWTVVEKRVPQYLASFLILEGLMIGVFAALDALLFYVLWEAMLMMFVIIGVGAYRGVRDGRVLPGHVLPGRDAGVPDYLYNRRQLRDRGPAGMPPICRSRPRSSSYPLRSSGADVAGPRGCRTRTSKRRPAAR